MKHTITPAERLQINAWITDARHKLADVGDIERDIAEILGAGGHPHDAEAITDAIAIPTSTVDDLLGMLGIAVSEDVN